MRVEQRIGVCSIGRLDAGCRAVEIERFMAREAHHVRHDVDAGEFGAQLRSARADPPRVLVAALHVVPGGRAGSRSGAAGRDRGSTVRVGKGSDDVNTGAVDQGDAA